MILAQNHLLQLNGSKMKLYLYMLMFLAVTIGYTQSDQDAHFSHFLIHKVKKNETIFGLTQQYNISEEQIIRYNPKAAQGLKRKMKLQIPRYHKIKKVESQPTIKIHTVKPKETRWRIAFNYGISLEALYKLNPNMKEILEIGDEIRVPKNKKPIQEIDPNFNYYKVLPKEGYYRLGIKLGLSREALETLNPSLLVNGLQDGMIIKVPKTSSQNFRVEDKLLIEKPNLIDSTLALPNIKIALMAPFKIRELKLDSVQQTKNYLNQRNLTTISLDFYGGVQLALDRLVQAGLSVQLSVFDTENKSSTIDSILQSNMELKQVDYIVGPFIPKHFNRVSLRAEQYEIPIISPLSSNPVVMRSNVVQSIPEEYQLREQMKSYIDSLDLTEENPCVLIIADQKHDRIANHLLQKFPLAERIVPDLQYGFVKPDLVDSLATSLEPNWVFLETQDMNLTMSITSMLNAQSSENRQIRLFTTYRTNVYDNENIALSHLGNLKFSYPSYFWESNTDSFMIFSEKYKERFGKLPNREAIRGYDLILDLALRTAIRRRLIEGFELGETEYLHNRFRYEKDPKGGYRNIATYIIEHQGFETYEVLD